MCGCDRRISKVLHVRKWHANLTGMIKHAFIRNRYQLYHVVPVEGRRSLRPRAVSCGDVMGLLHSAKLDTQILEGLYISKHKRIEWLQIIKVRASLIRCRSASRLNFYILPDTW